MAITYLVFGLQGSGKTTQAKRLAEKLNLPFLDTGEQLRQVSAQANALGQKINAMMQAGQLVSNAILEEVVEDFLASHQPEKGAVIDGFPRNLVQCELLDQLAQKYQWQIIALTVEISDEIAKERLAKRFQIVDGQKVVRDDDQPAIVEKRLATYRAETLPVLTWIKEHYRLLEIDGEPSIDEVSATIAQTLSVE